jgi:Zn-dependent protease with chaperone function
LRSLQRTTELVEPADAPLAAFKISGSPKGFVALLLTHPPLAKRIERLQQFQEQRSGRFEPLSI